MTQANTITRVDSKIAGTTSARAIVSRGPLSEGQWNLEDVTVRPIKEDELLVDIIASGICHTDILIGGLKDGPGICYPRVLGHEGIPVSSHAIQLSVNSLFQAPVMSDKSAPK